jgi:hypothetical protein
MTTRHLGHWLLLVIGAACLLIAVFMVIPVAVNLPDSWLGGVLCVLFGISGVAINVRELHR